MPGRLTPEQLAVLCAVVKACRSTSPRCHVPPEAILREARRVLREELEQPRKLRKVLTKLVNMGLLTRSATQRAADPTA